MRAILLGVIRRRLEDLVRAHDWWEFKLAPACAVFYATALLLRVPVLSLWPALAVVVLALASAAAYTSVVNDLTDRREDRVAGKHNRLEGRPPRVAALLLSAAFAGGVAVSIHWRYDPLLFALALAPWVAFSVYSLPPVRWKARGALGVVADAAGAHLFPALLACVAAFRAAARPIDPAWVACIAVWSFAYGLRGILWHQLGDAEHDRIAGVATCVLLHGARAAVRLGERVAFPAELAALTLVVWRLGSAWPAVLLAFEAAALAKEARSGEVTPIIVEPRPRHRIVLLDAYDFFLPAGLLIASALRHPGDLAVLAAHALVFPRCAPRWAASAWSVVRPRRPSPA